MQNYEKLEQIKKEYKEKLDKIKPAKIYGSWVFNDTVHYQKRYGFDIGTGKHATWNNEADAFKHTFMQAQLALLGNQFIAEFLGDRHEDDGNKKQGQTKEEEQMDQWNNAQGREIAEEIFREYGIKAKNAFSPEIKDIIARKVAERMQAGKLILDTSGRRTLKKKLNIPGVNNNSKSHSQKDCAGSYPVSGYTRDDGTKVEGYTRTCYKHSRDIPEKFRGKKFQDLSPEELQEAIKFFI